MVKKTSANRDHFGGVASLLAAAIAVILSGTAWSQTTTADPPRDETKDVQNKRKESKPASKEAQQASELATVVVTGSAREARQYIEQKRDAIRVSDAVGEIEAGQLPAQNAAELISQLPAVMSYNDRTGDTNLTTTEGRFASVRGIRPDLNITTMDGLNLAIPNIAGRANFLDWFPVTLAKRVEVNKTFLPEDDGSGIGGDINIVTRSGFDYGEPVLNANASVGGSEINSGLHGQKLPWDGSVVYARTLSSDWAIAMTASINKRDIFLPSKENVARVAFNNDGSRATFFPAFNNFIGPTPGNGYAVPLINRLYADSTNSTRSGFATRIDYRPSTETQAWATLSYMRLDQRVFQSYSDVRQPFLCFAFAGCIDTVANQTPTTGTLHLKFDDAAFTEALTSRNLSELKTVQGGFDHYFNERDKLELKTSLSRATQDQTDTYSFFGQDKNDIFVDYNLGNPMFPVFSVHNPDQVFDPTTYHLRYVEPLHFQLREDVTDTVLNFGHNAEQDDQGFGYKVGARVKTSDRDFRELYMHYAPVAGGPTYTAADYLSGADVYKLGITGITPTSRPVLLDPQTRDAKLLPLIYDPPLFTPSIVSDLGNDYKLREVTSAAFAQARYVNGGLFVGGGVRYERTSLHGSGYQSTNGGNYEPVSTSGWRGYWLPSALMNYDFESGLKLRLAYSKTLGRPPYDALAPKGQSVTYSGDPASGTGTATVTISNPNLRPRQSNNYDAAVEWYFDEGKSLVSLGLFDKEIKDEIFAAVTTKPMVFEGKTYSTTVIEPMNTDSAYLRGVEASFVKAFTFLPAPFDKFGVQANVTVMKGDFSLQRPRLDGHGTQTPGFLPSQATHLYNASLFYSSDRLDVNVSLNRTGSYVVGFFYDAPQNDIYFRGRTLLNAKASWAYSPHLKFFLSGTNLSSQNLVEVSGPPELNNLRRIYRSGREFWLGVNYNQ